MASTVCWKCLKDRFLSERAKADGERLKCSVCERTRKGFSVERLAQELDPVLRQNLRHGRIVPSVGQGDDDSIYYEQQGDPLSFWVQEILGQDFDFEDELIDAVLATESVDTKHGEESFYDTTVDYEEIPAQPGHYYIDWKGVLQELKHRRRFFSTAAQGLFETLFHSVDAMTCNIKGADEKVVWVLPQGSRIYRARTCSSPAALNQFYKRPYRSVGPPPEDSARAGRMNVEGVVVLYGATDFETCLAEMRPALGGETVVIELQTVKPLRLLDFTRLEKSYGTPLSYFQPGFVEEVDRRAFLRRLHTLISQPIVPGREADYLITQTLAEYLAHVHKEPFDGILFKSVQRAEGTNVVLFSERRAASDEKNTFPVEYVDKSLKLFSTKQIQYKHRERRLYEVAPGEVSPYDPEDYGFFDDTFD